MFHPHFSTKCFIHRYQIACFCSSIHLLLSTKCHLGCVETNCWAHFGQILTIHLVEKHAGNIRIRLAISFCKDFTREFPEHQFRPKTLQNAFCQDCTGEFPEHRFRAKILQNAFCNGFTGEFPEHRFRAKTVQNAFCKEFTAEFPEHRFRAKILQNVFCKVFSLFQSILSRCFTVFLSKRGSPTPPIKFQRGYT